MNSINKEKMLTLLCGAYPCLRDEIVRSAESWISLNGEILWGCILSQLSSLILKNISEGEYSNLDEVFSCIEILIEKGDTEVSTLITTQLLESMLNSRDVDESLWRPLIGNNSEDYCKKLDEFYR